MTGRRISGARVQSPSSAPTRVHFLGAFLGVATLLTSTHAFVGVTTSTSATTFLHSSTDVIPPLSATPKKTKKLGLLTFDLDDTLYPISKIIEDANDAFVEAMEKFGFTGLNAFDIVTTGKAVREEIAQEDPERAAALTHTEIRELAIRREMEKVILKRKLQETADDWATPVDQLTAVVQKHAKQWAKQAVSDDVVKAVLTSWEMARHHSAERHIFPHVIEALKTIKEEHPSVIIGAVTDGRANPMLMTFTLAQYFDYCMSWEDEQGGRQKFFKELDSTKGTADLTWIYDAARHKYAILKEAQVAIESAQNDEVITPLVWPDEYDDLAWIHVGDDLAFDVGGSAACGAKTIYVELPRSIGQTAPFRFDLSVEQPKWATTPDKELLTRIRMNEAARADVSVEINTFERLPIAIDEILRGDV